MKIHLHRIYEEDGPHGYRVLVDRLWPRGISREKADLDAHWKELAPSDHLRKWFGHDPEKWKGFRKEYLSELSLLKERAKELLKNIPGHQLVLLYAAKDKKHTHALILKEYLEKLE
ncbi:uncharacterized protein yeaO [Waddlia chondrophila 2032/99]|uniref:Uroporphyrin-III C-methyltransferase n=2 Tax=Waddlia chondrophila TaxID=71667 RepID=D6YUM8_WADCW|nr:DUF488 family protein [Waddlia chondrophila]ADI37839.1 conserved hypothetical protein [Waddlia chondrophila WSU 86-1044]CCB92003.1 uncharacterized protein yeaO [Waddlia chondrophila 2032/99]